MAVVFSASTVGADASFKGRVETERLLITRLPEPAVKILDHVKDHGRITMAEAVTLTGRKSQYVKGQFRKLLEQGLVVSHVSGRGAWYWLR